MTNNSIPFFVGGRAATLANHGSRQNTRTGGIGHCGTECRFHGKTGCRKEQTVGQVEATSHWRLWEASRSRRCGNSHSACARGWSNLIWRTIYYFSLPMPTRNPADERRIEGFKIIACFIFLSPFQFVHWKWNMWYSINKCKNISFISQLFVQQSCGRVYYCSFRIYMLLLLLLWI